jgi:hypothetical protein
MWLPMKGKAKVPPILGIILLKKWDCFSRYDLVMTILKIFFRKTVHSEILEHSMEIF